MAWRASPDLRILRLARRKGKPRAASGLAASMPPRGVGRQPRVVTTAHGSGQPSYGETLRPRLGGAAPAVHASSICDIRAESNTSQGECIMVNDDTGRKTD